METDMVPRRLWVVAHRAGAALRPENTLAAVWNAIILGVDMVETDVKLTKDKKLVLFHSDELNITTDANGIVSDFTLEELRRLDAGTHFDRKFSDEGIPRLEDLFRLARGRIKILLDLKAGENYQQQIMDLISVYHMEFDVVMGVRSLEALNQVKYNNPTIRVLSLGYPIEIAYEILEAGADILRLWGNWVTSEHVNHIRSMKKQLWTMVGSPTAEEAGRTTLDEIRHYRDIGINGLILDDPRLAITVNEESLSNK